MIRNKIDGVDVPMKLLHLLSCPTIDGMAVCTCDPGQVMLVVDVHQQRLEHQKCPDCPTTLRGDFGPLGWFTCRCCQRAWRRRKDGYFDEQIPLDSGDCTHLRDPLA